MNTNLIEAVAPIMQQLHKAPAEQRFHTANDINDQLVKLQVKIAAEKRRAIRELRGQGKTLQHIAELLGVSVTRVKQLEHGSGKDKPTPEQAIAKLERDLARARMAS